MEKKMETAIIDLSPRNVWPKRYQNIAAAQTSIHSRRPADVLLIQGA